MYVDTGEAKSNGLFEHYEASPEAIESSAEDLDRHATNIQAFSTDVDSQHQAALANVSGVISQPLSTAAQTPTRYSSQLMGSTYVSSGSIRLFGQGVQHFNHTIDNLNEQYRQAQAADFGVAEATYPEDAPLVQVVQAEEARAGLVMGARVDLLRTLVQKHREALDRLDHEAEHSAAKISEGPTEQVLQDLYAAGALPSTVEAAFPNISFTANVLPADFHEMGDDELAEYLRGHPTLLNNAQAMAEVAERLEGLTVEDGESSGRTLRDALSGKASMTDVEGELALLSLVGMYGSYAQSRGKALPKGASQYIRGLFTDLVHGGAEDRTMDVLDWITAHEHETEVKMPPEGGAPGGPLETQTRTVPGFDQATQDWMKQAYADGILLMSDSSTNGLGMDYISPDVETALNDVLRAEESPMQTRDGKQHVDLVGGDGFAKLADLLGRSSEGVIPGTELALELTESSAETADVINTAYQNPRDSDIVYEHAPDALERFGPLLEQTVDVAARNIEANELLLANAGADPDSAEAHQLRDLYTFQWPDDGRSVSQYTDWISENSASEDPQEVRQAKAASASFIDFVTDTGDPENGVPNTFKTLMQGMSPSEIYGENAPLSLGEVNPLLAQTFGRVAASNLDALGGIELHENEHDTAYEDDGTISVSVEDRGALFTLVATDADAAQQLSSTIGAYEQTRLDQAYNTQRPDPNLMEDVGAEANRLDGYMAAGLLNASEITEHGRYETMEEAYQEHMRFASSGKTLVTAVIAKAPAVGGPVSNVMGLVFDDIIRGEIKPPDPPAGYPVGHHDDEGFLELSLTYDYVAAEVRAGKDTGLSADFFENGKLRPLSELSGTQRGILDNHLVGDDPEKPADPMFGHYLKKFHGSSPFESVSLNDVDMYLEQKQHRR